MGYDQCLTLDFVLPHIMNTEEDSEERRKETDEARNAFISLLTLKYPVLVDCSDKDPDTYCDEGRLIVQLYLSGRHLWESDGFLILEEHPLIAISKDLGCEIRVDYEGEEQGDCERIVARDGKIVSRQYLEWVEDDRFKEPSESSAQQLSPIPSK